MEAALSKRVAIFIDGAYLNNVLANEFGGRRTDYGALSQRLAGEADILRSYYYDCLPYRSNPPTPEEQTRYSGRRSFFDALERLPRYTVRLGRLARRGPDNEGAYTFEQKRVDIMLGVDMALLAAKNVIQEVILVAGDSDFVPAVIAAKTEGVLVRLVHGRSHSTDLWTESDERVRLTREFIDSVQQQPRQP